MFGRALLLGMLLLPLAMSEAEAAGCPCPKQKMVEMFGSIQPIAHHGPQKPPAVVTARELAEARLANHDLPVVLPLQMVASDQMYSLVEGTITGHTAHE
jgi:hypothetical protein